MRRHTAFYMSTLFLLLLFMGVLAVLTGVFSQAQKKSAEAKQLTAATELARNAAEAVADAGSRADLLTLLQESGNAAMDGETVCASYDEELRPSAAGIYRVSITYEPTARIGGTLVNSTVTVRMGENPEAICSLSTAVYIRGERAG